MQNFLAMKQFSQPPESAHEKTHWGTNIKFLAFKGSVKTIIKFIVIDQ